MAKPTVTQSDIQRLTEEREQADHQYNAALTEVDRALPRGASVPPPGPAADLQQLPRLNDLWSVSPSEPMPFTGWRARVGAIVWRMLAPIVQRQQEFNSVLVDHLNRQAEHATQADATMAATLHALQARFDEVTRFEARLVQCLQTITLYVDTKDRHQIGILRQQLEERSIALAGGLHGVSDELLRRWESSVAREQRFNAQVSSIATALDEIRITIAGFQRISQALKRELERMAAAAPAQPPVDAASGESGPAPVPPPAADARPETLGTWLDSAKYVGFEDSFRGAPEEIRTRVHDYLPLFEGASDVLDIGCGRGEVLELLAAYGITSRGVDINHAMVERCRLRGLDVAEGDGVSFLESQPDRSFGGMLAIQVVEHLQPDRLVRMLELAYHKLRPGSRIALETINPACWYAFFASYIRDITHVRPIHPDTLRYLLVASGFQRVEIRYREPYPERNKLQPIQVAALTQVEPRLSDIGETFNENVAKINSLLFTHLDFVAIGEKI
jgi:SAM-dependent methyltransferase